MDILLMEPSSVNKRRRITDKIRGHRHAPPVSLTDVTARLKTIRRESTEHLTDHYQTLTAHLNKQPGVKVIFAETAVQAAAEIQKINGDRPIAINKSAVVGNELGPELAKHNLNIIETYYDEFKPFDNQIDEYLRLPNLEIESVLNTFQAASHLDVCRSRSITKNGSKNFTGLIGLAAVSADDGTITLFQHMGNTGAVYEQAKKIILVAGLDKLVRNGDDAVFQTKCMAAFGWKAITKPKSLRYKPNPGMSISDMSFEISPADTDQEIHLILLDNGRSKIQAGRYKELLGCIGCRACTIDCPASEIFHSSGKWSPKEYITYFVQEKHPSTDLCLQCKTCRMNCPVDIVIPGMILNARAEAMEKNSLSFLHGMLANFEDIAKWGSKAAIFANVMSNNALIRLAAETTVGVSHKRNMPQFQKKTFENWFEKEQKGNLQSK